MAVSPETIGRLKGKGFSVLVQAGAGLGASIIDSDLAAAGAEIAADAASLYAKADIVAKIQPPTTAEADLLKEGATLVSLLRVYENRPLLERLGQRKVTSYALELVPRITRAQSMDILSSQANLAGYKAVLIAADAYTGLFPMLMTAAGTVRAARVLVIGAGVAGLQAIATARRLGAVVSAFDIRAAVKDQVKSLGAEFVEIDLGIKDGEGKGGYARELNDEERKRQVELLGEVVKKQDIVITTAAVPGRPAPKLISAAAARGMKPGSVIVDLAAESGGNCELTRPDETIREGETTIIGTFNLPSLVAREATNLFARNVMNFLFNLQTEPGTIAMKSDDEIVKGSLVTHAGRIVHPTLTK